MSNQGNIIKDNGNISNISSITCSNILITNITSTTLSITTSIITNMTHTNLTVNGLGICTIKQPYAKIIPGIGFTQSVVSGSTPTLYNIWNIVSASGVSFSVDTMTVSIAGIYLAVGVVSWASNGSGQRTQYFIVNGTTKYGQNNIVGAAINQIVKIMSLMSLAVNDTICIQIYQNCGSTLNILGDNCEFKLYKLG